MGVGTRPYTSCHVNPHECPVKEGLFIGEETTAREIELLKET